MKILLLSLVFLANTAHARMDQEPTARPAKLTPAQILDGIYQPWTGPLVEVERNLKADRNYVVWVHVPAQHPMDLRSSESFRRWALATPITELTISHNMVAFRCRNEEGRMVTGATGMTGASNLQEAKYLLAGAGVSIFFATYTDGHLNPQSEVDAYVTKNLQKRGAIFGAFEVTDEQCGAMRGFLIEFVNHPRRPFERFNNTGNPEKFEGGGCVTFASALMKKAGVLDTVIPHFFRDFEAARYLLGGNLKPIADVEPPATPWLKGKRRSISFNLFWQNRWDTAPEDFPGYVYLHQIDPEKMVYTLKQFASSAVDGLRSSSARATATKRLSASPLGLRTVLEANLVPDDSGRWAMEWERVPIDDKFDDEMAEVGRVARSWFRAKTQAGFTARIGSAVGMPVLVLDRP